MISSNFRNDIFSDKLLLLLDHRKVYFFDSETKAHNSANRKGRQHNKQIYFYSLLPDVSILKRNYFTYELKTPRLYDKPFKVNLCWGMRSVALIHPLGFMNEARLSQSPL